MSTPSRWSQLLNTLQIRPDYSTFPSGLAWRSNTVFIVATIAIGLFTDLFLYGLVVPVLPFMLTDRIGVPDNQVQRYVSVLLTVFAAASFLTSPIAGLLADRLSSRQVVFLSGLMTLLAATFLLFLGTAVWMLVVARILQGASGAIVWTVGLALCLETVGPANLGKTIGSIFSFISVGSLLAPIVGGILYDKTGYWGVLGIGCAMISVDLIMRLLLIEKKVAQRYQPDNPASVGEEESIATSQGDQDRETQPLLHQGAQPDEHYKFSENHSMLLRVFPILSCLADPQLLTALWTALIQAVLIGAFDSTIPIVARDYFGFSSLQAGLLFIPLGIADLLLGPLFGWCVDKFGTKPVAVLAYAYLIPILVLLRLPHAGGQDQIIVYGALLALSGLGLAGIGAPSIVEAGAVVERYHKANPKFFGENGPYAQLYGMSNMCFSLGLTFGPELAGELKEAIGYGNMNLVLAAICALTSLLSFLFIGRMPAYLSKASV